MRYRTIDVRIWGDEKFRALSPMQPSGQALFLYLLTNPNTTSLPGLYRSGAAAMAEELGWALEGFKEAFQEAFDQGLAQADWKSRLIFIPNAIKYNKPQSPNVVKSWASHWDELPECDLKNTAYQPLKSFIEGLGQGFVKAFEEAFEKPLRKTMSNQEQDQEPEQEQNISVVNQPDDLSMRGGISRNNCPHQEIIELYHTHLPMCRKVKGWNNTRKGYLKQRWLENPKHQNLQFWKNFFEYVGQSNFLIGQKENNSDKPPFQADLEWLIRPSNFVKIIEGKYHGDNT